MLSMGLTVGGAILYVHWRDRRSTARNAAKLCARCGRGGVGLRDVTDIDMHAAVPLIMCERCIVRTARNHRAVKIAMVVLGGGLVLLTTFLSI